MKELELQQFDLSAEYPIESSADFIDLDENIEKQIDVNYPKCDGEFEIGEIDWIKKRCKMLSTYEYGLREVLRKLHEEVRIECYKDDVFNECLYIVAGDISNSIAVLNVKEEEGEV